MRCVWKISISVCVWFFTTAAGAQTFSEKSAVLNSQAQQLVRVSPDSAFTLAEAALHSGSGNSHTETGKSHQIIGSVLLHRGLYSQALDHLLSALNIFTDENESALKAGALNQLGLLYENIHEVTLAEDAHRSALAIYTQANDSAGIAYTFVCMGQLFERLQKFDSALAYQRTALQCYRKISDVHGQIISLTSLGTIYEHQQRYDTAMNYYQESLAKSALVHDSLSMIRNLNNVGDVYRGLGNIGASLAYTYKSLAIATRHNEKDEMSRSFKDLAKSYFLLRDFEKAFQYEEENRMLHDAMRAEDAAKQVDLFQKLFQMDEKEDQINRLTSESKIDTVVKVSLGTVVILLALAAWLGISRQKLKLRKEQEDSQRNREMLEAKEKIIKIELENTHLRERQLQQELRQKTRSLSSQALQITGQVKVMEVVHNQLEQLMTEQPPAQRKRVRHLLKRIDNHTSRTDQDWETFRKTFENIDDAFFEKISRAFPDLTPAEIRLASLIRTAMPAKAMAETLGISQGSLRIGRYRLKKKLKLAEDQKLQSFILSL